MTINSPIIDAGPTTRKIDVRSVVCNLIEPFGPGTDNTFNTRVVVDGSVSLLTYTAQWHGQMIFTLDPNTDEVSMYIAIEVDGDITWKEVSIGLDYEDPRTGKEKDPNYDLYYPSAS